MSWCLRIPSALLVSVRADLARTHKFAAERVGFLEVALGNSGAPDLLILATAYVPVPDDEYIDDPHVGARIGGAPIRRAVERALIGRVGVFHVHGHDHAGSPGFSPTDLREIPPIVRSLRVAAPACVHGALLLSSNSCNAIVWLPGAETPARAGKIAIVGRPLRIIDTQVGRGRIEA